MIYPIKYSIILPIENKAQSKKCLISLLNNIKTSSEVEIICVHNNKDFINELNYDNIIFLSKDCNNIFELINYGISQSKGEYIILLNEDVEILHYGWIDSLYNNLKNNSIVGVNMMNIHNINFMYLFPSLVKMEVFDNYKFGNFEILETGCMDFCDLIISNNHIINYIENNICKYSEEEKISHEDTLNNDLINAKRNIFLRKSNNNIDVCVEILTSKRSFTTLPMTLTSILNQTKTPRSLLLIWNDDEEYNENNPRYSHIRNILQNIENKGTEVIVLNSDKDHISKKHQFALETNRYNIKCKYQYRIDDDCIAETNTLENLYNFLENNQNCYAVSPLVIDQNFNVNLNEVKISSKIENIFNSLNEQWVNINRGYLNVDHLYSSFMFRISDNSINYNIELSPISHREETLFTFNMKLNGYSLFVDTTTKIWHYRNVIGGNRNYTEQESGQHILKDEKIFQEFLIKNNILKKK